MLYRLKMLIYSVLGQKNADNIFIWRMLKKCNKDIRNQLKLNLRYKDTHIGERCFILGNGPSLKDVDFSLISKEFVFTVNNFSLVENYKKVKTNVHLWADLSFFELREDQKYNHDDLMKYYIKISEENPICFMPVQAYDFVNRNRLNEILNINYFNYFSSFKSCDRFQFDLAKTLSSYSTVVQYAISIAIYMGFKEIYLLGCDSTNVVSMINAAMNIKSEGMHAYKNDDVNERYQELLKQWSMADVFYDQYLLFEGYKTLKKECDNRGIKLVNCSTKTLINELPRADLLSILS